MKWNLCEQRREVDQRDERRHRLHILWIHANIQQVERWTMIGFDGGGVEMIVEGGKWELGNFMMFINIFYEGKIKEGGDWKPI